MEKIQQYLIDASTTSNICIVIGSWSVIGLLAGLLLERRDQQRINASIPIGEPTLSEAFWGLTTVVILGPLMWIRIAWIGFIRPALDLGEKAPCE